METCISCQQRIWDVSNLTWDSHIVNTKVRLKDSSESHDVVLNVNCTLYYAKKQILSLWSPVLQRLLSSLNDDIINNIDIQWNSANAVLDLLVMMYTQCEIEDYKGVDVYNLARVASHFDVQPVLNDCMQFIAKNASNENMIQTLQIALDLDWETMKFYVDQSLFRCDPSTLTENILSELSDECTDFLLCHLYSQASTGTKPNDESVIDQLTNTLEDRILTYQIARGAHRARVDFIKEFFRSQFLGLCKEQLLIKKLMSNFSELGEEQLQLALNINEEGFDEFLLEITPGHVPVQGVSETSLVVLVKYAAQYRIPTLALRCLAHVEHESVLVCIQIASTFARNQDVNRTRLLEVLRTGNPLQWLHDHKELIKQMDDRSKAIVMECMLAINE